MDVGANIGLASAYFRMYYPEAVIHCFECDPFAVHLLKQNAISIKECQVYSVGLYSEDISKVFYTGLESTVHSSIHENPYGGFPQSLQFKKASSYVRSIGIERIDILKIDTEGCELQILKDLFSCIGMIKIIYLEFHSEEDRRLIDQLLSSTHVLWQGDVLNAHRGNLCYLHRSYVPQVPWAEPLGR